MKVLLIRHGQTDFNRDKKYYGHTDIALNETGISQGKQLAAKLAGEKIEHIYSSDLVRAYEFAQIVCPKISIKKYSELREINFGLWEGLTHGELMTQYQEIYQRWIDERRVLEAKVSAKREVHCRGIRAVEVDLDMSAARPGRPYSPYTARSLHFGDDRGIAFLPDNALAIPVGIPSDVFARSDIIGTCPVEAGR